MPTDNKACERAVRCRSRLLGWRCLALAFLASCGSAWSATVTRGDQFEISYSAGLQSEPMTGRLFLLISKRNDPEVRLQDYGFNSPEFLEWMSRDGGQERR